MQRLTALWFLTTVLWASTALGQNWGGEPPESTTEAPVASETVSDGSLASAAKGVGSRNWFGLRRLRRLGITGGTLGAEVRAMHASGELAGLSQAELAHELASRLAVKRPTVFRAEAKAWEAEHSNVRGEEDSFIDRVIALIIRLLPFILFFF